MGVSNTRTIMNLATILLTKLLPQLGYDTMQAMCEFKSVKKRRGVKGSVVFFFNSHWNPAKKLKKGPDVSLQKGEWEKSSSLLNLAQDCCSAWDSLVYVERVYVVKHSKEHRMGYEECLNLAGTKKFKSSSYRWRCLSISWSFCSHSMYFSVYFWN